MKTEIEDQEPIISSAECMVQFTDVGSHSTGFKATQFNVQDKEDIIVLWIMGWVSRVIGQYIHIWTLRILMFGSLHDLLIADIL